jgi:hypothetical protein
MLCPQPFEIIHLAPLIRPVLLKALDHHTWQRSESNILDSLDNRSTAAQQIDVDIRAVMHSELSAGKDQDAAVYGSNVCGTIDVGVEEE